MATDSYVELILKGSGDLAKGFIEGLRIAVPGVEGVWFSSAQPMESASLVDSIKEKLHLATHVVVTRKLADLVIGAIEEGGNLELELVLAADVDYAELGFEFECYSREDGASLRRLLEDDLPSDVRVESYEVEEEVDEEARGIEMYSPAHDYILRGSGMYVGPVPEIFAMARRLEDQDFVHPSKVKLHHQT